MQRLKLIPHSLASGKSQSAICAEVHCSKQTVSGYKRLADGTQKSYEELLAMSDSELKTILNPSLLFCPTQQVPSKRKGYRSSRG